MGVPSAPLTQAQNQAAVGPLPRCKLERFRGQRNTPLEIAVWDFEPPDRARAILQRNAALGPDQHAVPLVRHLDQLGGHSRQSDDYGDLAIVLEHVDRWLP